MLGQVALLLAERMCEFDTGSGTAALSKELRAVMVAAVQGAPAAADPVDELRARRDRKRSPFRQAPATTMSATAATSKRGAFRAIFNWTRQLLLLLLSVAELVGEFRI